MGAEIRGGRNSCHEILIKSAPDFIVMGPNSDFQMNHFADVSQPLLSQCHHLISIVWPQPLPEGLVLPIRYPLVTVEEME